ncbi:MAG: hypothetical protein AB1Z98_00605, partial [Nannocystaceae bacterium]
MTTANGDAAATADAELQRGLDALFRGPRERFVAERNALAKRLRAEQRREDAALVMATSKPSVSAWAVGQLWWTRRDDVLALRRAGDRQRRAVQQGAGPAEAAAAARERRQVLDALLDAAAAVLAEAGHAEGTSTMRRIGTTLEALAAYGSGPDAPHPGRLTKDLDPPGFEMLAALGAVFEPAQPEPDAIQRAQRTALAEEERAHEAARAQLHDAARALDVVTREAEAALLSAQQAEQEQREADAAVQRARQAAETAMLGARRARTEAG